jgi:hypothetical protein
VVTAALASHSEQCQGLHISGPAIAWCPMPVPCKYIHRQHQAQGERYFSSSTAASAVRRRWRLGCSQCGEAGCSLRDASSAPRTVPDDASPRPRRQARARCTWPHTHVSTSTLSLSHRTTDLPAPPPRAARALFAGWRGRGTPMQHAVCIRPGGGVRAGGAQRSSACRGSAQAAPRQGGASPLHVRGLVSCS